jgi:hypothetical protein
VGEGLKCARWKEERSLLDSAVVETGLLTDYSVLSSLHRSGSWRREQKMARHEENEGVRAPLARLGTSLPRIFAIASAIPTLFRAASFAGLGRPSDLPARVVGE